MQAAISVKEQLAELDKLTVEIRELSALLLTSWAMEHIEKEKPKSFTEKLSQLMEKK